MALQNADLFVIQSQTDNKLLKPQNVHIWDASGSREFLVSRNLQSREEDDLGPVYGFQWRHSGAQYKDCHTDYSGKGFDQLDKVIKEIKTNPTSRRILMSDFDPATAYQGVLYPCHSLILQFYVREGDFLDVKMYQR